MTTALEKTHAQYAKISENLLKRYALTHGIEQWSYRPLGIGPWLQDLALVERWSKKTVWLYRAALVSYLLKNGPIESVQEIQKVSTLGCPNRGFRTSSQKEKKLSKETLKELCGCLYESRLAVDHFLIFWLVCGKLSGLRPCEWETARMEGDVLWVRNAKFNEVRATGEHRTLDFSDAPEQAKILREFLKEIQRWISLQEGSFAKLYKKCRSRLRSVCVKLWPRRKHYPSLYSPRHQFAADLKSMGVDRETLAALMGHASDETASIHYARSQHGDAGGVAPGANPLEVAKVRSVWSPPPAALKDTQ